MGGVFMKKWELSLLAAVLAAILWCGASPRLTTQWWTAAFAPLCDGLVAGEDDGGEGIVLRSWLWETLSRHVLDCEAPPDVVN